VAAGRWGWGCQDRLPPKAEPPGPQTTSCRDWAGSRGAEGGDGSGEMAHSGYEPINQRRSSLLSSWPGPRAQSRAVARSPPAPPIPPLCLMGEASAPGPRRLREGPGGRGGSWCCHLPRDAEGSGVGALSPAEHSHS